MSSMATVRARQKRKQDLVYIHGGKCALCGYNRCIRALHFHHINPNEKVKGLSNGNCQSWEEDVKESKKCILVCSNCHMEIHEGLITQKLESSFNQKRYEEKTAEKASQKSYCQMCGKEITTGAIHCFNCSKIFLRTVERPSREELKVLIRKQSFLEIGRKFQVSDNSIRKWCDAYHLPRKKTEIQKYSDEEWEKI